MAELPGIAELILNCAHQESAEAVFDQLKSEINKILERDYTLIEQQQTLLDSVIIKSTGPKKSDSLDEKIAIGGLLKLDHACFHAMQKRFNLFRGLRSQQQNKRLA
jgi:hypothetical protein